MGVEERMDRKMFIYRLYIALTFLLVGYLAFVAGYNGSVTGEKVYKLAPIVVNELPCPLDCGSSARRYRDEAGHFWRCSSCSPGLTFRDADGKPVLEN